MTDNKTVRRILHFKFTLPSADNAHFLAIPYGGHFIWGATAGMLLNLYRRLNGG